MIGETIEYLDEDSKSFIKYKLKNAVQIEIETNLDINIERYEGKKLVELVIDCVVFEIGQTIDVTVDDINYQLKILRMVRNDKNFELITENKNKSSIFVLPSLGNDMDYFSFERNFVNTYLTKNCDSQEIKEIFIVYRSDKSNEYVNLIDRLSKHHCYIESYDFGNTDVVLEFRIPEKYVPEVVKFIQGKYSAFSDDYKSRIYNFFNKSKTSRALTIVSTLKAIFKKNKEVLGIMYPSLDKESLNEAIEVYPKVEMEDETINVNKLK